MPLQLLWSAAARVGSHFFDVFASDTKDLTERRGFVEMSLAGRTDTPTTEDPRGTPERGSISISIATWMLDTRNKTLTSETIKTVKQVSLKQSKLDVI
jgi:hypothetical protein